VKTVVAVAICVATHAMVFEVLFRGITPEKKPHSPVYVLKSLIPDVCSLLGSEVNDAKSAFKMLGIDEGTLAAMQKDFRRTSSENFLEARSNACDALKEGVTLGGVIPWEVCFRK
jgi:hypothetical protein